MTPKWDLKRTRMEITYLAKVPLINQTIVSTFGSLKRVIENVCEEENEDGSYLSEVQIRDRIQSVAREECKQEPEYDDDSGCVCEKMKGACGVLPGDTVFWEYSWTGNTMTHFEPATEDELVERGWLPKRGERLGKYSGWAKHLREEKAKDREEKAKSDDDDFDVQGANKRAKQG